MKRPAKKGKKKDEYDDMFDFDTTRHDDDDDENEGNGDGLADSSTKKKSKSKSSKEKSTKKEKQTEKEPSTQDFVQAITNPHTTLLHVFFSMFLLAGTWPREKKVQAEVWGRRT